MIEMMGKLTFWSMIKKIWRAIWLTGVTLFGIYVIYFIIMYRCGEKEIEERNDGNDR